MFQIIELPGSKGEQYSFSHCLPSRRHMLGYAQQSHQVDVITPIFQVRKLKEIQLIVLWYNETGHSKMVHWENPEGWDREGVGKGGSGRGNTSTPMDDSCQCMAKNITIL